MISPRVAPIVICLLAAIFSCFASHDPRGTQYQYLVFDQQTFTRVYITAYGTNNTGINYVLTVDSFDVPISATPTPTPTMETGTPTPSTETGTPSPTTETGTPTPGTGMPGPSPTPSPSPISTETPTNGVIPTLFPSPSPTPLSPTPTPTQTPTSTPPSTETPTGTSTSTPSPTETPTGTPTSTPFSTETPTPSQASTKPPACPILSGPHVTIDMSNSYLYLTLNELEDVTAIWIPTDQDSRQTSVLLNALNLLKGNLGGSSLNPSFTMSRNGARTTTTSTWNLNDQSITYTAILGDHILQSVVILVTQGSNSTRTVSGILSQIVNVTEEELNSQFPISNSLLGISTSAMSVPRAGLYRKRAAEATCTTSRQCSKPWWCAWLCSSCSNVNTCCYTFTQWKTSCYFLVELFEGKECPTCPTIQQWLPCFWIGYDDHGVAVTRRGDWYYGTLSKCWTV